MDDRTKWPAAYAACLILVAVALALLAPDDGAAPPKASAAAPSSGIPDIAGNWVGTWQDTDYTYAHGDVSCTFVVNGADFSADGVIDLTTIGLGEVQGTAQGTISREGSRETLVFTFSASFGSGECTCVDGSGSGSGSVSPYGPFVFEGTATASSIDGRFDFTNPGGGGGVVHMIRDTPVESETWTSIKSRYRGGE